MLIVFFILASVIQRVYTAILISFLLTENGVGLKTRSLIIEHDKQIHSDH